MAFCFGIKYKDNGEKMNWVKFDKDDESTWPEHGQHVLVWNDIYNIYPFPRGNLGDDNQGRYKMGDAIFWSGDIIWEGMIKSREAKRWKESKEQYLSCGNDWHRWRGQGPCSFYYVTHWMALPSPPKESE
jgi:hypothetical protein